MVEKYPKIVVLWLLPITKFLSGVNYSSGSWATSACLPDITGETNSFHGNCTMETVPWKLYHGNCSMETVPWKLYHGNCSMETVPWKLYHGNFLNWALIIK